MHGEYHRIGRKNACGRIVTQNEEEMRSGRFDCHLLCVFSILPNAFLIESALCTYISPPLLANLMFSSQSWQHPSQVGVPVTAEVGRSLGLVVQNLLNLLHDLRCQLSNDRDGAHVVLNLLDLGGTKYDSANMRVLRAPSQAQLSDIASETLSDLGQALDLFNLGLAFRGLEGSCSRIEKVLVVGEAGALGNAVVVLAGEETGGERGPDGCTILELLVKRRVFDLETLAVEC
jgi:hypothetical protein